MSSENLPEKLFKISEQIHRPLIVGAAILAVVGLGSISTLALLLGGYALSHELSKPRG